MHFEHNSGYIVKDVHFRKWNETLQCALLVREQGCMADNLYKNLVFSKKVCYAFQVPVGVGFFGRLWQLEHGGQNLG